MTRTLALSGVLLLVGCAGAALHSLLPWQVSSAVAGQEAAGDLRLPGARPVIDAARYPSLQAAFDAIPAEA